MGWDELRARWNDFARLATQQRNRLTARDFRVIAGNRERLVGVLQQRYGRQRGAVERDVREFTRSLELPG